MSHAVARLRQERLERSSKPFIARGSKIPRCPRCRIPLSHCLCHLQPETRSRSGFCLLMHDIEPLKPSNTGWLIADLIADTWAFGWSRTRTDPALVPLLQSPDWQPVLVFPGEYAAPQRVVEQLPACGPPPLFVLLDATWPEARKMFRKTPCLDALPVLSLQPATLSRYQLRRSTRGEHLCTAEVAALCLELAGDIQASRQLDAWLDTFTAHYQAARHQHAPRLPEETLRGLQPCS